MNWAIEFFPFIPFPYFWGLCTVSIIVGLVLLLIKRQAAFFRILSMALLIAIIANPHLKQEQREPLKNIVIVVTDESGSQKIARRAEITQKIRKKLSESLSKLGEPDIRWVTVKNTTSPDSGENSGTTLFASLKKSLSTVPSDLLAGVFLITDGQIHDVPKQADSLGLKVPVHLLITGNKSEIDQRIEIVKAPRFGLVGSQSTVQIRVVQHGDSKKFPNQAVVHIKRENQEPETRQVKPGDIFEAQMDFPHAGANFVEIELEAVQGELTLANNRVAIVAQGVRENLRVLLVSGEPHAGERTWRNLLKSDASVDLVHFTILRPPEKQDGTPINQLSLIAFPTRQLFSEKLHQFDLIIFDRYRRRGVLPLLYLDNIARYVERGGAILVAAGSTYASPLSLYSTPLSQVLPAGPTGRIIEEPYKAKVTDAGKKHPVTRNLPGDAAGDPNWGRWFRLIQVQPKEGDILMKGPEDNPLLILNRLGQGRVALLVSDHAWLWARGYDGGGPYIPLLRRLAHWLMKEPDLEEEFLSATKRGNHIVIERRSMQDQTGPISVQSPDGKTRSVVLDKVEPGVWRKAIETELPGLYRFRSGQLSTLVHSGVINSLEMSNVSATSELLQPILDHTGGGAFWLNKGSAEKAEDIIVLPDISILNSSRTMHGADWMAIRDRKAYKVEGVIYLPVAPGLFVLLLIAGLMTLTWYREGK